MNEQMIVTIVVAIIGSIGASAAAVFGFLQFWLKRKDDKEDEKLKKMIAEMISQADDRLRVEFNDGLTFRGDEGKERFEINSRQIQKNAETVEKILSIQEDQVKKSDMMMESLIALNQVSKACAEGVKSTLYDKIFIVSEKAIARKGITVSEKANIKQLYNSYSALNGNGKGEEYAKICLETLETITDEEAKKRDELNRK